MATDRLGNADLTRTASVIVNLIDKNDNFPHFTQGIYTVRVLQGVSAGASIITVNVSAVIYAQHVCVFAVHSVNSGLCTYAP